VKTTDSSKPKGRHPEKPNQSLNVDMPHRHYPVVRFRQLKKRRRVCHSPKWERNETQRQQRCLMGHTRIEKGQELN
jgi:hypothetical protein